MTKKTPGWHETRFCEAPNKIQVDCVECGTKMWLPPSKVKMYRRCGARCQAASRAKAKEARSRPCQTCGEIFTPRPYQISVGDGRFCSHKCAPGGLNNPITFRKARARLMEMFRSGAISFPRGPQNKKWQGGPKASRRRRTESGKAAATLRRYRKQNPEKVREWGDNRRSAIKGQKLPGGTVTRIFQAQRKRCAICRDRLRKNYHLDHILAIAKGGQHIPANVQLLCPTCNTRKSAKDMIDFMRSLGRLL